jgi:hypothetical protein
MFRDPEVRAMSALTRVFDVLWRASNGDGPATWAAHPSRRTCGAHLRMTDETPRADYIRTMVCWE